MPECDPDDIIIKTEGCGICAGDLKCYHGAAMFWGDTVQPSWVEPPFIPGHEFLGYVVKMGENVTEFKIGDRITADQIVPCGECRFCKSGRYWMCQPHAIFGFQSGNNGGMADNRLEKAKEFGADLTMSPGKENVAEKILELTDGYGCDIYIETTGHPSSVQQGLGMIRKLGTLVEFSVFGEPATIDWSIIGDRKELDVPGAHLSPYAYPFVIKNIANGNLKTDGIVSKTFPIEEWETAFEHATGKFGDFKVAITF